MALTDGRSIEAGECAFGDVVVDALLACRKSNHMLDAFARLAASFGFEGFTYLLLGSAASEPHLLKHWTTAGPRWTARYATRGYHLIDPRVTLTRQRSVPVIWSLPSGSSVPRVRSFVQDAARHSIRSGIAWSLHDARIGRVVIAWDSKASAQSSDAREASIQGRLASLALLAGFVHEAMMVHCQGTASARTYRKLTSRERECVALAAHGMTSVDVAVKLGITPRTANFHFGNILSKLGALNRSEAIARAVAANLVSLDH